MTLYPCHCKCLFIDMTPLPIMHVPLKIVENCEGFRVVSVCEALHASSHAASWILESLYLSSEISREMHSLRMCCWKEYRERGYGLVLEEKRTWGWVLFHSWLFRPRWAVILGLFLSVLKTHLMSWGLQKQGYLCLNSLSSTAIWQSWLPHINGIWWSISDKCVVNTWRKTGQKEDRHISRTCAMTKEKPSAELEDIMLIFPWWGQECVVVRTRWWCILNTKLEIWVYLIHPKTGEGLMYEPLKQDRIGTLIGVGQHWWSTFVHSEDRHGCRLTRSKNH